MKWSGSNRQHRPQGPNLLIVALLAIAAVAFFTWLGTANGETLHQAPISLDGGPQFNVRLNRSSAVNNVARKVAFSVRVNEPVDDLGIGYSTGMQYLKLIPTVRTQGLKPGDVVPFEVMFSNVASQQEGAKFRISASVDYMRNGIRYQAAELTVDVELVSRPFALQPAPAPFDQMGGTLYDYVSANCRTRWTTGPHQVRIWELQDDGFHCIETKVLKPYLETQDSRFKKLGESEMGVLFAVGPVPNPGFAGADPQTSRWVEQNGRNPRHILYVRTQSYDLYYDAGPACPGSSTSYEDGKLTFRQAAALPGLFYTGTPDTIRVPEELENVWTYDKELEVFVLNATPGIRHTLRVPTFGQLYVPGGIAEQGGLVTTNHAIFSCYQR